MKPPLRSHRTGSKLYETVTSNWAPKIRYFFALTVKFHSKGCMLHNGFNNKKQLIFKTPKNTGFHMYSVGGNLIG